MNQFRSGDTTETYEEFRRAWGYQSKVREREREQARTRRRRIIRVIAAALLVSVASGVYYFTRS